jgi:hypothetical protein
MTPAEEAAVLAGAEAAIEEAARLAQVDLIQLIRSGVDPLEAVRRVTQDLGEDLQAAMAAALSRILVQSLGEASSVPIQVGPVSLSRRLYVEAEAVGANVRGIVQEHARGFQDARSLALQLFEGYGFRPADAEPLQFNPREDRLPRYLRELVRAPELAAEIEGAFARMQADGLSTQALRAAYTGLLGALDDIARGKGATALEKRLEVAFFERMRYFAKRIAITELHRAYMDREADLLMADVDVEFVQVRRAPGRQIPCICSLVTQRDRYGLGPGVYPKAQAPRPPLHPFCRCVVAPRLDLTGSPVPDEVDGADRYFLTRVGESVAARIMGSAARRDRVLRGESAEAVANAGRDPAYRIRTVGG